MILMVMFLQTKIVRYSCAVLLSFFVMQGSVLAASSIRITELMYNPTGNGDREFVEFYNGDNVSIDMSGWYVVGVGYTIPNGSILKPGKYAVIVRNYSVFASYNPSAKIFGQYPGKLKSGGELVRLVDGSQNIVSQLSYQSGGSWPTQANNNGPSLSLIRVTANENSASCWAPSSAANGTPGYANSLNSSWVASHGGGCGDIAYAVSGTTSSPTNSGSSTSGGGGGSGSSGGSSDTATDDDSASAQAEKKKKKQDNDQSVSSDEQQATATDQTGLNTATDTAAEVQSVGVSKGSNIVPKVIAFILLLTATMLMVFWSAFKKKLILNKAHTKVGKKHVTKKTTK